MKHMLACFPDAVRLNAPDWFLSLRIPRMEPVTIVCPLSMIGKLRKYDDENGLPRPMRLVVPMDCHIGDVHPPVGEFLAVTPFGSYLTTTTKFKPSYFVPTSMEQDSDCTCTECHFGCFPCRDHLLPL